jgi:hypothetical protein
MDSPNRYTACSQSERVASALKMADECLERNNRLSALAKAIVDQLSPEPEGKNGDDIGKLTACYLAEMLFELTDDEQLSRIRGCIAAMREASNGRA